MKTHAVVSVAMFFFHDFFFCVPDNDCQKSYEVGINTEQPIGQIAEFTSPGPHLEGPWERVEPVHEDEDCFTLRPGIDGLDFTYDTFRIE